MPSVDRRRRVIVGISGASGAVYGLRALAMLREHGVETHLVVTRAGLMTLSHELAVRQADLASLADFVHPSGDIAAPIASGSFLTDGMLVAPCSIKTLSEIAHGITGALLSRAADVTLKERRRLVLMVRETPLHLGHLRSMSVVCEMGGTIMPPVPAFYTRPTCLEDLVDHTVGRMLDQFGLHSDSIPRWH